jgi:50S ribosomal protein L16 3-hydroxylase
VSALASLGKPCSYNEKMKKNPLGTYNIDRFLRDCWQKKPLVLRGIAPGLADALRRDDLIDLACRDDAESRLIIGSGRRWEVRHGPFRKRDFAGLPARRWTLLVNGVDTLVPAARQLQNDFGFIPFARQDDVMVSYAAPGGGVGPHFDSYDVFLLQGAGTRRWQISNQRDLSLLDDAPLKILSRFRAQQDWRMQSGDLLYLPPHHAHHGVAIGECLTWSIGMRAPTQREVASEFLDYLQDRLQDSEVYRDPGLKPQAHRAEIGPQMQKALRRMVERIRWGDTDIDRCIGQMLSEPRQNVVFSPEPAINTRVFSDELVERGLQLDLKTRLLFDRKLFFINGEAVSIAASDTKLFRQLADERALAAGQGISHKARVLLQCWHEAGYVHFGDAPKTTVARRSPQQRSTARRKPG